MIFDSPHRSFCILGFGFCDFDFGFAHNERGGRHPVKMESLGLEKPTKRESGVMGIGFLLMLGTLFFVDSSIKY